MSPEDTDGHPAPVLRRAAALMRERADAATRGPWRVSYLEGVLLCVDGAPGTDHMVAEPYLCGDKRHEGRQEADAEHIASWHPGVAVTVAAWLDDEAEEAEDSITQRVDREADLGDLGCLQCRQAWPGYCRCWDTALTVARAYLGEAEDD